MTCTARTSAYWFMCSEVTLALSSHACSPCMRADASSTVKESSNMSLLTLVLEKP
jgi:hypothetical protein